MAIGGAIASVVGGLASASAAKKGAAAQAQAAADSNETQRYIYDTNVALSEPWRETGTNALAAMAYEMGLGPKPTFGGTAVNAQGGAPLTITEIPGQGATTFTDDFGATQTQGGGPAQFSVGGQTFGTRNEAQSYLDGLPTTGGMEYQGFQASPGYNFALEQGNQGLERQQAARGMRLGGPAMKEAIRYNSGVASQEYGNFYNRLAGLSGTGQTAVNNISAGGQNYANAVSNNNQYAGNAAASGYAGQAKGYTQAFNGLANMFTGMGSGTAKGGQFL